MATFVVAGVFRQTRWEECPNAHNADGELLAIMKSTQTRPIHTQTHTFTVFEPLFFALVLLFSPDPTCTVWHPIAEVTQDASVIPRGAFIIQDTTDHNCIRAR